MSSQTYVIFGASGGIGSATARMLAGEGADLVLAARRPGPLQSLAEEVGGYAEAVDATDVEAVDQVVAAALDRFEGVAGIVGAVGSLLLKPAHLTTVDEWDQAIAANLTSAFAVVRAASKRLRGSGASVVLVSSAAARVGLANHEAIAAAKAGIEGLVRAAAATYAAQGLRFNAVAPGQVRTPLTARLTATRAGEDASLGMHPLGRLGEPEDIASAIVWLLSPRQSWISGEIIAVDGGLAALRSRKI